MEHDENLSADKISDIVAKIEKENAIFAKKSVKKKPRERKKKKIICIDIP